MKVYLVSPHSSWKQGQSAMFSVPGLYVMESYLCIERTWMHPYIDGTHPNSWDFMLDSGAFSYLGTGKQSIDWDSYLQRYADFIVSCNVKHFFELDIDVVVGLPRVETFRKELESRVQRQSIPVWHRSRGLDYWHGMVKDYDYVSIGASGRHDSRWCREQHGKAALRKLVEIAHEHDCQVHGLGYTLLFEDDLFKGRPRFDSVDSTSWLRGMMGGYISKFDGTQIIRIEKPPGTRWLGRKAHLNNWLEWVKFQRYADHAL